MTVITRLIIPKLFIQLQKASGIIKTLIANDFLIIFV